MKIGDCALLIICRSMTEFKRGGRSLTLNHMAITFLFPVTSYVPCVWKESVADGGTVDTERGKFLTARKGERMSSDTIPVGDLKEVRRRMNRDESQKD